MSTLEEKLKRISDEMQSYRPKDDEPCPERHASCLHEVTDCSLDEVSGGLMEYACGDALNVLCLGGDFEGWDIRRAAFVDTETTGLAGGAGTVAFLIGLGYVADDRFVVEQFFMEDYDVEGEMLSGLCRKLAGFDWLVTFNGKCFDAPLIASRAILNRIAQPLDNMRHIDLLHAARRVYRRRLGQCTLANLEHEVLGRGRERDVPGSLVPEMFFEYLRTGDFGPMRMVLEHNRRDVVSLLSLLCRLCFAVKRPEDSEHADDAFCCGRMHERAGRPEEAERFYRMAGAESADGLAGLSMLLKRRGRHGEARELWLQLRAGGGASALMACEELAKHYEHREGDRRKALEIVEEAMVQLSSMGFQPDSREYTSFFQRRERLNKRLNENG